MSKVNFKDKHLRYGGYGTLLTVIVIAIAIIFNIIVTNLNIKIDTTSEKIFSVSDTTKDFLKTVNAPINIYVLEETGKETSWLQEILLKYQKLNNNIEVIYKDPVLYPTFGTGYLEKSTQNLSSIPTSSLIVENESTGKFKIVPSTKFTSTSTSGSGTSIEVENAVTNAIGYVFNASDGSIYYTTGHNELNLSMSMKNCLDLTNLSSKELNLLTDELPDPANSAILINSPHTDFTQEEVDKVIQYLENGGKALIFLDADVKDLPIFDQLLSYYGVAHQAGVAVEAQSSNMLSESPAYLIPEKGEHDIISNLSKNNTVLIFPVSSALKLTENTRSSVTATPILTTSKEAFLKTNVSNNTLTKQTGDVSGPLTLAYAIEDQATGTTSASGMPNYTRLLVFGNSFFISDDYINVSATGNANLMTSSLGWLLSVDTGYAIEGKTEDVYAIKTLSSMQFVLTEVLVIIVIPLVIVIVGIVVWVKRRHL